jgi:hypothetical protein
MAAGHERTQEDTDVTQGIDGPGMPGTTLGEMPLGGAAPPEAGTLPSDAPKTEQVKEQAANVAGTAATQTKEVASTATSAAGDVAATAVEKVGEVQQEAVAQVRNLVSETTSQVRSQAEAQTTKLAEGISGLGDQLRALVEGRPEEAEAIRDYVQQGADKLAELSNRLQSQGLEGTIDEVQRFARRRPGMFLLGALGVGFGVGRLVRGAQAASSSTTSAPGMPAPMPTEVRGVMSDPVVPAPEGLLPPAPAVPPAVPPVAVSAFDDPTLPIRDVAPPTTTPGGFR